MSTNINNAAYSTLNAYAVLASSGITTVNTTTIANGVYGTPGGVGIVGVFIGTLDGGANATTAQTQLTALVNAILATTITSTITGGGGTIIYIPGRYNASATILYTSGTNIVLDAQGDTSAQFFFTSGSTITFTSIASITLINGATNCNVYWLAGSAIAFSGTSPIAIPGIYIGGSAITFDNGSNVLGRLYAQTQNVTFSGTSSVDATCSQNIVCYVKGTMILTDQGIVPIEELQVGDNVVTKGKIYDFRFIEKDAKDQIEPVIWIGKFKVKYLNDKSRPICIEKNAFGSNIPFQDLYVSPGHSLIVENRMAISSSLMNGKTIYQDEECIEVEYYHVECRNYSAIYANGMLAESYYDSNNRYVFDRISDIVCKMV
jgi:hypothetical protein